MAGTFSYNPAAGTVLSVGAQNLSTTFTPSDTTDYNKETATVTLTVNSAGPALTISPTSLTFAAQDTGSSSAAQKITLTNSGSAALSITSIAASGDFAETNNCGASIAASGNCTISATFTPTAGGTRTGTLTITDNASGSPQSVALTGTGSTVTMGSSSSSLSIGSAGGSASAQVQLAGAGGFTGMVNLACAVTYQGSGTATEAPTCSLNPTQEQVSGTGTVSATLTVNTTGSTSARMESNPFLRFGAGAMAALLLFIGVPARRRRGWDMLVVLCFAIAGSCLGCGGGGSSAGNGGGNASSNPGTTTGNYIVAVKATSGTVTTSITIPLTVQ